MKKLLLFIFIAFIGCNSYEEEKPIGKVFLNDLLLDSFQHPSQNSRTTNSEWLHIFKENSILRFQNNTGESTFLEFDPNDWQFPYQVQLAQGEYSFNLEIEGNIWEDFLPFEVNGQFVLGNTPQEISLIGNTNYSLITIETEWAESVTIQAGEESKDLPKTPNGRYFFQYVRNGEILNLEVREKNNHVTLSEQLSTGTNFHYHFTLNFPEIGNTNFVELNLQEFEYSEEEIMAGSTQINSIVRDGEGNVYKIIQIGNQIWMAENLRTSKFCNGEEIMKMIGPDEWWDINFTSPAYYNVQYDSFNDNIYGKLYNVPVVNDERNVCPCGWEIPTVEDWRELRDFLGGTDLAAMKMQSPDTQFWWPEHNQRATNESGFNARGAGLFTFYYPGNFYYRDFNHVKEWATWWSFTQADPVIGDLFIKRIPVYIRDREFEVPEGLEADFLDTHEDMTFRSIRCILKSN